MRRGERRGRTCYASLKTWKLPERIERTIARRRVEYRSPAQFIRSLAAVHPRWRPVQISVAGFQRPARTAPSVCLQFGCDPDGLSTSVRARVTLAEAEAVMLHLIRRYRVSGMLSAEELKVTGGKR
jgi:hypothetical protein